MKDQTNKVGNVLKKRKRQNLRNFFFLESVLTYYSDLHRTFFFFPTVYKNINNALNNPWRYVCKNSQYLYFSDLLCFLWLFRFWSDVELQGSEILLKLKTRFLCVDLFKVNAC